VVRVGAAVAPVTAGRLPCGGEEVGFTGDGLGGSDGDEAVSPSLAGDGRWDCIISAAAGGGCGRSNRKRPREARAWQDFLGSVWS
jgi:hypothetical protein